MKRVVIIPLVIVVLGMLMACSGSASQKMILPGEKIGDFTITTGVEGNFTYGFAVECSEPGQANTYTCNAKVGETINVSTGLRDTTGSGKLETIWEHSNYQMFINNRPVDLAAFGTIDYNHPTAGVIRFANVVILADKPGTITVRDSGIFDNGDPFSSSSTYVFTQP